jgi:hypothetical protein
MSILDKFTGVYGADWNLGVLGEHMDLAVQAGVIATTDRDGQQYAVAPDTVEWFAPVVCGDIIWVYTEDGQMDGRCGLPVVDGFSCEGHAAEREGWYAASEAERIAWERARD